MDWVEKWLFEEVNQNQVLAHGYMVDSFINIHWCLIFSLKSIQAMVTKKTGLVLNLFIDLDGALILSPTQITATKTSPPSIFYFLYNSH